MECDSFKSIFFKMLIRFARLNTLQPVSQGLYSDRMPEHPNQAFILKQLIDNQRFRHLILMRKA